MICNYQALKFRKKQELENGRQERSCRFALAAEQKKFTSCQEVNAKKCKKLEFTSNCDETCYVSGIGSCKDTDVVIPSKSPNGDTVTGIGDMAFLYCTNLTNISIPKSVATVGNYAFAGCTGLTSITIPESVTTIGATAFKGCSGLTSITIPNNVTTIESSAFAECRFTSITIPESVTKIVDYTFGFCQLTSINIPRSITTIEMDAFYACIFLTDIHFDGTKADWNAISKGDKWDVNINEAYTVHCTDGDISKS